MFTADSDNLIGHIGVGEIIGCIVNFYSGTDMVHEAQGLYVKKQLTSWYLSWLLRLFQSLCFEIIQKSKPE